VFALSELLINFADVFFRLLRRDIHTKHFGVWRSWLAHLHGVQGVVCSSQITPTISKREIGSLQFGRLFFFADLISFPHDYPIAAGQRIPTEVGRVVINRYTLGFFRILYEEKTCY